MVPSGWVFDVRRYSVHDGPGIRTTVFLKGCPLRCAWCHNPESQPSSPQLLLRADRCVACGACVDACPVGAIERHLDRIVTVRARCQSDGACTLVCPAEARELVGRRMSVDEVLLEVERDQLFYDESGGGATFSGGEPLFQADFVRALLSGCRDRGIRSALDTSGFAPTAIALDVAAQADLVLFDVKHIDPERHLEGTGVGNAVILANLRALLAAGVEVVVRIPLVPGFNDAEVDLRRMAGFLAGLDPVPRVQLLPFHGAAEAKHRRFGLPYGLAGRRTQSDEELSACRHWFGLAGVPAEVGG